MNALLGVYSIMRYINRKKLDEIVGELLSRVSRENCIDEEEYRLHQSINALPIGFSLGSYVFINTDGEVVCSELELGEFSRINNERELIPILAWGAERYPSLIELIQEQPIHSEPCPLCGGSKVYGTWVGTDEIAKCILCNGLGWMLKELLDSKCALED